MKGKERRRKIDESKQSFDQSINQQERQKADTARVKHRVQSYISLVCSLGLEVFGACLFSVVWFGLVWLIDWSERHTYSLYGLILVLIYGEAIYIQRPSHRNIKPCKRRKSGFV